MKKFINLPENVVEEMLQGLAILNPGSSRLAGHNVMLRSDAEQNRHRQVAVISGGGSGHGWRHSSRCRSRTQKYTNRSKQYRGPCCYSPGA